MIKKAQRVGLTEFAAVVDAIALPVVLLKPVVIWTNDDIAPPWPDEVERVAALGLTITTLPAELAALEAAASVAAVERSPATAANDA
jgi:hypothetical protein